MKLPLEHAWIALAVGPIVGKDKIDEAIDLTKRIRVPCLSDSDQLIERAGGTKALPSVPASQSQNRKEVLSLLKRKADESWETIGKTVDGLKGEEEVRVRRFWIVSGFPALPNLLPSASWPSGTASPMSTSTILPDH